MLIENKYAVSAKSAFAWFCFKDHFIFSIYILFHLLWHSTNTKTPLILYISSPTGTTQSCSFLFAEDGANEIQVFFEADRYIEWGQYIPWRAKYTWPAYVIGGENWFNLPVHLSTSVFKSSGGIPIKVSYVHNARGANCQG